MILELINRFADRAYTIARAMMIRVLELFSRLGRADIVGILMVLVGYLLQEANSIPVRETGYTPLRGVKAEFAHLYWQIMALDKLSFIWGVIAACGYVTLILGGPRRRQAVLFGWGWGRFRFMGWINVMGIVMFSSIAYLETVGIMIFETALELRAYLTGDFSGNAHHVWNLYFYDWDFYLSCLGIVLLIGGFLRWIFDDWGAMFLSYIGVAVIFGGIVWWLFQGLERLFGIAGGSWWTGPVGVIALGASLVVLAFIPLVPKEP